MSTNFPTSIDTAGAIKGPSDSLSSHPTSHKNLEDALQAIETKVGINSSADASSLDYKVNNKAPVGASFLTATSETGLSSEVNLGALTTGLLKHTVSAGVSTPATAIAGTDYLSPTGSGAGLTGITASQVGAPSGSGTSSGTNTGNETATTIGALIGGAGDATPNDTDFVATSLTAGGILKKITWTNVKAFLKTYFDTLYQVAGSYLTSANIDDTVYGAGWNADTTHAPSKNAVYDKIESMGRELWYSLTGTYVSATTFTTTEASAAEAVRIATLSSGSLFLCTNSTGFILKYGYIKSTTSSSTTITYTVITNSDLASGDINFKYTPSLKADIYEIPMVEIPGEAVLDASNKQGRWLIKEDNRYILPVDFYAITAAAGAGAACGLNLYSGPTALFTAAVDLTTNAEVATQRPNQNALLAGAYLTLRITTSAGATNKASDISARIFAVPADLYYFVNIQSGFRKAIFGYGFTTTYLSMTNLVSNIGVVATDVTGVGTARYYLAAAGYGGDKAIFGYGSTGVAASMTNLVSNTGVVATDVTGVGTARATLAAAGYGGDKAIFGYGLAGAVQSMTNLVSNIGVVATDVTGVGTARYYLAAAGYGGDKAIFGYGYTTVAASMTNLVSNIGVVATDVTGVGTARQQLAAAGYGGDKAIFGYGDTGVNVSMTNLVSNTGVVATDVTGVGTARAALAAAGYGGDKAIFGYGYTTTYVSMTNLVSNTGVVATDVTGVGTARYFPAAAGYGL
jgi:hypothetical protein